ncbi:hydroxymethylglutaryl-CoA lyase [Sclerotinia borealis F-4128]|uniref:hydroxymethylglutaryl-CoA lyase n=1 Tax=Sclerotinia borealis (strain F-4128) TaxID=1432307 RepID=W9C897_SCLBF|nr:hydroxymethylglutaryl-CoA lyase [Sclerotinia borealis F-4128]
MLSRRIFRGRNLGLQFRQLRRLATAADPLVGETNGNKQHVDNRVKIVEVGPRDGLQNEKTIIPLATKVNLIERLAKTGLQDIEAGSFVAPKWVPQMADASEILEHVLRNQSHSPGPIRYSFLAPNKKGLDTALDILSQNRNAYNTADVPADISPKNVELSPNKPYIEMAVFAAATESFSQKNLNCDIATSLKRFEEVIQGAKAAGMRVRAYISVVLGCPFEGDKVDPHRVAEIATELLEMGADEIDLGDTTGMGTGLKTSKLLRTMQSAGILSEDIAMHFHDTYGQALINTVVSLEHGIRTFDSSVGGLGGCPYSPGATGNIATEDMVYLLESMGMQTGVDLDALADVGQWITGEIGKPNASSVGRAIIGARSRK